ncbi:MAG: mercuric reductase [Acidobacteriota bacterium]
MHDVIVIGTGQAAPALATRLAKAGRRVLVVEKGDLGGTCVNTGCTPTKTLIASARAAHVARTAGRLGVRCTVDVDFPAIVARKDAIVQRWRSGVEKRLARAAPNLELVRGHARFVGPREIEAAGQRYRADTIVLNVGGRAVVPPIPGLDQVPYLDHASVMALRELPRHLIVLGGGYIGCEYAQMFRRFGAEVTVVDQAPHLMPREDDDVAAELDKVFRAEGISLVLGAKVARVAKAGDDVVVTHGGGELRGSHLLVAVGRRPNSDDLGCDKAGVALDKRGFVVADERYRTTAEGVYALGDCIDQPQFTHVAWDDHRILYDILAGDASRTRAGRHIPYTAFTDPQVAGVGLNEREAKAKNIKYELATMAFGDVARAIEVDETAGIFKLLIDPASERILGATIVGCEAGELVHVFIALMQAHASVRAVVDAEMVHPAFAEGLQSVAMRLPRFALS